MAQQESAAVRNANKHFRKEAEANERAHGWKELSDQEAAALRQKTARLRAQRLARDASPVSVAKPSSKSAAKTGRNR